MAAAGGVWLHPALWGINEVPSGFWCAAGAVDRAFPEDVLPVASKQLVVWLGLSMLFFLWRGVHRGHRCSGCPGPSASHRPSQPSTPVLPGESVGASNEACSLEPRRYC